MNTYKIIIYEKLTKRQKSILATVFVRTESLGNVLQTIDFTDILPKDICHTSIVIVVSKCKNWNVSNTLQVTSLIEGRV